ncbi:hypothetical protein OWV82_002519 [Melia azedarach]|uniref:Uncharacterized protein n=1 Tax=Melia azedarach TaxID=155640 RepID=A0ACC1Z259_MELAZ|nr:hypothetical protein OWV82_002519 [Melia azedarach]
MDGSSLLSQKLKWHCRLAFQGQDCTSKLGGKLVKSIAVTNLTESIFVQGLRWLESGEKFEDSFSVSCGKETSCSLLLKLLMKSLVVYLHSVDVT